VAIERYEPKRVGLQATVAAPSVLLLNDRYHPDWKVYVNGQARPLLRCNYIMRGVRLEPGEHSVEFRFEPSVTALYVSLASLVFGLVLLTAGFLTASQDMARAANPGPREPRPTPGKRRR
jgi:uncharacterized membrane protein YfhO